MTTPSSGALSFTNLSSVFGVTSLSFLRSKHLTVPSTGPISLSQLRGLSSQTLATGQLIRRRFNNSNWVYGDTLTGFNAGCNNTRSTELIFSSDYGVSTDSNYVYEYTGWLYAPDTGTYTFGVRSDDASDLALDLGSGWDVVTSAYGRKTQESTPPNPGSRSLTGGTSYPIRIRYYQNIGTCALAVEWITPGNSTYVSIPYDNLRTVGITPITTSTLRLYNYREPRVTGGAISNLRFHHPDGRSWRLDGTTIRLNTGTIMNITLYTGNDVFNAAATRVALFNNNSSSQSVRHASFTMFANTFTANNLDFAWYFIQRSDGLYTIGNDYGGTYYVGYDSGSDRVLIMLTSDSRVVGWLTDLPISTSYLL